MKRKALTSAVAAACIVVAAYTLTASGQDVPARDAQTGPVKGHGMMTGDRHKKMKERMKQKMKGGGMKQGMGRGPAEAGSGTARGEGTASDKPAIDADTAAHKH